jgi:hypothetical protein
MRTVDLGIIQTIDNPCYEDVIPNERPFFRVLFSEKIARRDLLHLQRHDR